MFNKAIEDINTAQLGERIRWYQARPCTCYDPQTNYDQQQGCSACEHGQVYVDQGIIKAVVTDVKREMIHPDFGLLQVGDLILRTMPGTMIVQNWDKIVLLDRPTEVWDRLVKGSRDTFTNIANVVSVMAVCVGSTDYIEGTDWSFTAPNTITWLGGGTAPAGGSVYTAFVRFHPTFWYVGSQRSGNRPAEVGNMPVLGRLVNRREEA